jgi:hypothetical protein
MRPVTVLDCTDESVWICLTGVIPGLLNAYKFWILDRSSDGFRHTNPGSHDSEFSPTTPILSFVPYLRPIVHKFYRTTPLAPWSMVAYARNPSPMCNRSETLGPTDLQWACLTRHLPLNGTMSPLLKPFSEIWCISRDGYAQQTSHCPMLQGHLIIANRGLVYVP